MSLFGIKLGLQTIRARSLFLALFTGFCLIAGLPGCEVYDSSYEEFEDDTGTEWIDFDDAEISDTATDEVEQDPLQAEEEWHNLDTDAPLPPPHSDPSGMRPPESNPDLKILPPKESKEFAPTFGSWAPRQVYEMPAYDYLGNYPSNDESDWFYHELQGIANDGQFWYFSNNQFPTYRSPSGTSALWKVSIDCDLKYVATSGCYPYWRSQDYNYSYLESLGCDHFGDIDYYHIDTPTNDRDIIAVAIEGCSGGGRIGFFDAYNLSYISSINVNQWVGGSTPWVSINTQNGNLYLSKFGGDNSVDKMTELQIDWNRLANNSVAAVLGNGRSIYFNDSAGNSMYHHSIQGADFSTDGKWFHLLSGHYSEDKHIHAYRVSDENEWNRVAKSKRYDMPFKFETNGAWWVEEPEGVDFTNMNNRGHSTIKGDLHVILLNNQNDQDNIWLKHYEQTTLLMPTVAPDYGLGTAIVMTAIDIIL